jgi:hypothetical protein
MSGRAAVGDGGRVCFDAAEVFGDDRESVWSRSKKTATLV